MQVSLETIGNLERKMTVRLPSGSIDQEVGKRLRSMSKRIKIDGFRPGKVPFKLIQQRFGAGVYQDVIGDLVQSSLQDAIQREQVMPAGTPEIELMPDQAEGALEYTAVFEVYPEIELAPLAELRITRLIAEVADTDVDQMIETLRKQNRGWEPANRSATGGDQIILDYRGLRDGKPFPNGAAENQSIILGEGHLIGSLESQLHDSLAGDERTLDVTFPEDYPAKDLAGQMVQFEIRVKKVNAPVLPVVDEAFAALFGSEVETLREEVRRNIVRELKATLKEQTKTHVMDALCAANEITAPKSLVKVEIRRMREQVGEAMSTEARKNLPDDLFQEQAARRVNLGLLIAELVHNEKIRLDSGRVDETLRILAEGYEEPEQVIQYYQSNRETIKGIEALVLEDQVVDRILEKAQVEDENQTFNQIMNPTQRG